MSEILPSNLISYLNNVSASEAAESIPSIVSSLIGNSVHDKVVDVDSQKITEAGGVGNFIEKWISSLPKDRQSTVASSISNNVQAINGEIDSVSQNPKRALQEKLDIIKKRALDLGAENLVGEIVEEIDLLTSSIPKNTVFSLLTRLDGIELALQTVEDTSEQVVIATTSDDAKPISALGTDDKVSKDRLKIEPIKLNISDIKRGDIIDLQKITNLCERSLKQIPLTKTKARQIRLTSDVKKDINDKVGRLVALYDILKVEANRSKGQLPNYLKNYTSAELDELLSRFVNSINCSLFIELMEDDESLKDRFLEYMNDLKGLGKSLKDKEIQPEVPAQTTMTNLFDIFTNAQEKISTLLGTINGLEFEEIKYSLAGNKYDDNRFYRLIKACANNPFQEPLGIKSAEEVIRDAKKDLTTITIRNIRSLLFESKQSPG